MRPAVTIFATGLLALSGCASPQNLPPPTTRIGEGEKLQAQHMLAEICPRDFRLVITDRQAVATVTCPTYFQASRRRRLCREVVRSLRGSLNQSGEYAYHVTLEVGDRIGENGMAIGLDTEIQVIDQKPNSSP